MGQIEKIINEFKEDFIQSIQELVRINSVEAMAEEGKPFGKGVDDALRYVLDLADHLGFKTTYKDGYYGYIEMGEGKEIIGILAHLDVVPVEKPETWNYPPFGGEIHDNKLYGRGAVDDKGPLLAALFAMKALLEKGVKLNKRVRLILGTNEETRWEGIKKYLEQEEIPSCGFTPDSDYPLINAEKGLLQIKLFNNLSAPFSIKGGGALNSVPDYCLYKGNHIDELGKNAKKLNYGHKISSSALSIEGKAVHSAKAWQGINAIGRMALLLEKTNISNPLISFMANEIGEDCYGSNIFGKFEDDISGKLTINMGKIKIDENGQELYLDIRFPVMKSKEEVIEKLKNCSKKYQLSLEVIDYLPSLHVPEEHKLVKILRSVFEETTGLDSHPISTGGATYARAFKNFVAFGPLFPGKPKLAHKNDEYVDLEDLMKSVLMYSKAIERLATD